MPPLFKVTTHFILQPICDWINKGGQEKYVRKPHTTMLECIHYLELIIVFKCTAVIPLVLPLTFKFLAISVPIVHAVKVGLLMFEYYYTLIISLIKTVGSSINYKRICSNTYLSLHIHNIFLLFDLSGMYANCHSSNSFTNITNQQLKQ